ncbi:hypothetical protein P4S73_22765 [Paraglaciecola sp. Hal342]
MPNLSMVALALMLTQRAWTRLLSTGVAVAFSPLVYLSRYLTTSFWRGFFIALRSKKWSYRFAESRLFLHSLSESIQVGKCLPTFCFLFLIKLIAALRWVLYRLINLLR